MAVSLCDTSCIWCQLPISCVDKRFECSRFPCTESGQFNREHPRNFVCLSVVCYGDIMGRITEPLSRDRQFWYSRISDGSYPFSEQFVTNNPDIIAWASTMSAKFGIASFGLLSVISFFVTIPTSESAYLPYYHRWAKERVPRPRDDEIYGKSVIVGILSWVAIIWTFLCV